MSVPEFFATNLFEAIKQNDVKASGPEHAFCEMFERPQAIILRDFFRGLPNVNSQTEYPYSRMPTTGADLFVQKPGESHVLCEIKSMYKTWFRLKRPQAYPSLLLSPFVHRKSNSAGHDLRRLALFPGDDTTHVAQ